MNDNNSNQVQLQGQDRITGQIAVHKTDKKLLEFIDGLNLAPLHDYAAIHAGAVRPHEQNVWDSTANHS